MLASDVIANRIKQHIERKDIVFPLTYYLNQILPQGGKPFVENLIKYGCTEKGDRLNMPLWFREYGELLGDFRVSHVLVTGCAQSGKTLMSTLLNINTIITTGLNTVWFYASRESRDLNCAEQFLPAALHWIDNVEREKGIKLRTERDRDLTSRFQIGGATAMFSYTSTSKASPQRAGLASVGGAAASLTANLLFLEERSQMLPGTADP